MKTSTLHIKVSPEFAGSLKRIASRRGESVGEIVRQAVVSSFQAEMTGLPLHQKQALEAYCGGFISIGKLSEIMGRDVLGTRGWLNDHDIRQNTEFSR
jgi:predicted transcriptional regulator